MTTESLPSSYGLNINNNLIRELEDGPFANDLMRCYQLDIKCTCNLEELIIHKWFVQDPVEGLQDQETIDFCEKVRNSLEEIIMVKNNYNQMLVHALFAIQKQEKNIKTQETLLDIQSNAINEKESQIKNLKQMLENSQGVSLQPTRNQNRSKSFSQPKENQLNSLKSFGTKSMSTLPSASSVIQETKAKDKSNLKREKQNQKNSQPKKNIKQCKISSQNLSSKPIEKNAETPVETQEISQLTTNPSLNNLSECKESIPSITQLKTRENSSSQIIPDLPKILEVSQEINQNKESSFILTQLHQDASTKENMNKDKSPSISKGNNSHRNHMQENSGVKLSDIIAMKDIIEDPLTKKKKLIQFCEKRKNERVLSSGKKKSESLDIERFSIGCESEPNVFLQTQKLNFGRIRRSKSFGNNQKLNNSFNEQNKKSKVLKNKSLVKSSSSGCLSVQNTTEPTYNKASNCLGCNSNDKENKEISQSTSIKHRKNKKSLNIQKMALMNITNNENGKIKEALKKSSSNVALDVRLDSERDYQRAENSNANISLCRTSVGRIDRKVRNIETVYGAKSNPKAKNWAPILSKKI